MNMLFDKLGNKKKPITLLQANITQEINGEYSCKIITLDEIQGQDIIELEDLNGTKQLFRLTEPNKDLEVYTANGWHITQDLANDMILNRAWLNTPANKAWPEFLKAGIYERRFYGECDFLKVAPLRIVRTNILEAAIGSKDNTFTNRFGGELERDNYKVNLRHRLGLDKNFSVKLGRDIQGLNIQTDYNGIFNRVIPTYLDEHNQARLLSETYLDSPNIELTATPITRHIHYSDVQIGAKMDDNKTIPYPDEESAIAEVKKRVSELWEQKVDQPSLRIDIDFILLYETDQYSDYKDLLKLSLGDSVKVILDEIEYKERLVMYQYDSLNKELIRAVLGKPYAEFNYIKQSINSSVAVTVQEMVEQTSSEDNSEAIDELLMLNKAAAQASGFYLTVVEVEDGPKRYYYHDQPKLEDSKYIEHYAGVGQKAYTDSGWNNGNPVWKTGEVDGNLIANIVKATTLNADQINGGTIDARKVRVTNLKADNINVGDEASKKTLNDLLEELNANNGDLAKRLEQSTNALSNAENKLNELEESYKQTLLSSEATEAEINNQLASLEEARAELEQAQEETKANLQEVEELAKAVTRTFNTDALGRPVISKADSDVKLVLDNDKLSFVAQGSELAYFGKDKAYISALQILQNLNLGKYTFEVQADGGFSIKWID